MTLRSAAVYGSCGAVLVACLAAANMPSQDSELARTPQAPRRAPEAIAVDVQSQAARLHARMADAPAPVASFRNPFAFNETTRIARPSDSMVHAAIAPVPPVTFTPAPPQLVLMGIAEDATPAGPQRTAVLALPQAQGDSDDVLFAREGDSILGRYRVTKIGADAVELEDLTTNAYRRLALR